VESHFGKVNGRRAVIWVATSFLLSLMLASISGFPLQAEAKQRQGGLNQTESQERPGMAPRFGLRVLREGMSGPDVRVLNSIIASRPSFTVSFPSPYNFTRSTTRMVKRFQTKRKIRPTGVVTRRTAKSFVASMKTYGASWYGPGFFGNRTACGQKLRRSTVGVAHKKLPCGTRVLIGYRGRYLLTRVIDRGPFIPGRTWDLSSGARKSLGYSGIDRIRAAVVGR